MNTVFEYMYRDASNYKAFGSVVVKGKLTFKQLEPYLASESEGTEFIPSQVGMKDLQSQLNSYPSEDDHVWHNICSETFEPTKAKPTLGITADELVSRFRKINKQWDVVAACKKHGFEQFA